PAAGDESRGEHDRLEGERRRDRALRDHHEGRDRADPRTGAERRMRTLDPAEIRPQPERVAAAPLADDSVTGAAHVPPPERPRQGFLLLVSGPSGAGKGTLVSHLIAQRPGCVFSVSATTRLRRTTEFEGREYIFLS